jgi:hypothetical protein
MNDKDIDFTKLGFNVYQIDDLKIMLSLTPKDIPEWALTVGPEDVSYGLSLVECLALAFLDEDVANMTTFPEADVLINKIRKM